MSNEKIEKYESERFKNFNELMSQNICMVSEDEDNYYIGLESDDPYGDGVIYEVNKKTLKFMFMFTIDYLLFINDNTTLVNLDLFKKRVS